MTIRKEGARTGQVTEVEGQPGIEKTAQAAPWGAEDEEALRKEDEN